MNDITKFLCYNKEKDETFYVGDKDDLILLLSKGYEIKEYKFWRDIVINKYFPDQYHPWGELIKSDYLFFNDHGVPVEINKEIQVAAKERYGEDLENLIWEKIYRYRKKNKTYIGEFRRGPVEGIHRYRQHYKRNAKVKRYKQLVSERLNPEMKEFCRGNKPDFWDLGYIDYKLNKSWKKQSKRKHQWKDK